MIVKRVLTGRSKIRLASYALLDAKKLDEPVVTVCILKIRSPLQGSLLP